MFKIFIIGSVVLLSLSLIAPGCASKEEQSEEHKMHDQDATSEESIQQVTAIYYTCPMPEHKEVGTKEPGTCPQCQMNLVAAMEGTAQEHDFYGCPMSEHSHIRSEQPGVCAECGMDYKPIKLVEVKTGG